MLELREQTSPEWAPIVLAEFDTFLVDHAACERKAAASAMSFVVRYPDRPELVREMIALAIEELEHFREVNALIEARGLQLAPDEKDPYINPLLRLIRVGRDPRLLDRLLLGGVVEARGCERFGLVAEALAADSTVDPAMAEFYREITRSEARHHGLFVRIARRLFPNEDIKTRLGEILDAEAEVIRGLPLRPALH